LRQIALETNAQIMVIGRPMLSMGQNVFTPQEFEAFATELERETGIQVIPVLTDQT
jgi:hypothetical protein